MEPNNRMRPQDITPRGVRPDVARTQASSRPLMSDFGPRPQRPVLHPTQQAQPTPVATPQPTQAPSPTLTPNAFAAHRDLGAATRPIPVFSAETPPPAVSAPQPATTPTNGTVSPVPVVKTEDYAVKKTVPETKSPKIKTQTGHAGLVGLLVFIITAALLMSSLLPGKIFQDFPLSSQSFSAGEEGLACIKPLGTVQTSLTTYNTKLGFPITYKFATTTTQTATCEGKLQTATGGHATQFNPLGALINLSVAAVFAFIFALIWRKIFGHRDY